MLFPLKEVPVNGIILILPSFSWHCSFAFVLRQWLSRNKLEPLGVNSAFDTTRIMEIKQCKLRQDVRRAYDEATKTCGGMVSAQRNSFSKPQ